jgi:hypothetical protein
MNKILNTSKLFLLLLLCSAIYIFQSCSVSTANLGDVRVCSSLNSDGECNADAPTFPGTAPVIYCSAKLKNAPSGTKVTFEWKRGSEDMGTASVETGSGIVNSNFKPNAALEPGKYSVTVKINSDNSTPVTKEFTIE